MSDLTVVVPIHDPMEIHTERILRLVTSLIRQNVSPKELILASNHVIMQKNAIDLLVRDRFNVQYLRNESRGAAENTNYLLDQVRTRYTKIMFQDDFFFSSNSLNKIEYFLSKSRKKWLVNGCNHFLEETKLTVRPFRPKYKKSVRIGINSIGAPSVVAFESDVIPRFNESMVYMFDCDWYLQMKHHYGKPFLLEEPLVSIGIHPGQATNWAKKELDTEIKMVNAIHSRSIASRRCSCRKLEQQL